MNPRLQYEITRPRAAALSESLRAFGYDLPAAIADLIDNSLSAGASEVRLSFIWSGSDSTVTVTDNGNGMEERELVEAMRLGTISPLEVRDPDDLGRFGLGLKTASFSQCRRLKVATKKKGHDPVGRCWDLDFIASTDEWKLLKLDSAGVTDMIAALDSGAQGTVVTWERLDRIVGDAAVDDDGAQRGFYERIDAVKVHLAMVFHKHLTGPRSIKIWINGSTVNPWDPFLIDHPKTIRLPFENLQFCGHVVRVSPYVLPHHSSLEANVHDLAGGLRGWNAHQGFYVYRNRRMLVAGDWLGLGFRKEEHYKLARIAVEFPSTLDNEWHIDVKKSRAYPPLPLTADLRRIAKKTREQAVNIYRHRGHVLRMQHSSDYALLWARKVQHGKFKYVINREYPLIKDVLQRGADDRVRIKALLSLLEETVPIPNIVITNSEQPDSHASAYEGVPMAQIVETLKCVFRSLIKRGLRPDQAKTRLLTLEPFFAFPELVAALDEDLDSESSE